MHRARPMGMRAILLSAGAVSGKAARRAEKCRAQIRAKIRITGRITPDDLSPEMQADFISLYRRWRRDAKKTNAATREGQAGSLRRQARPTGPGKAGRTGPGAAVSYG
jgi:hypothetical protein